MLRQDINGKLWHRGTKLGVIYAVVTFIIFGITMTQEPDGPYAWLSNFGPLLILMPLAAASHAYSAGQIDQSQKDAQQKPSEAETSSS